MVRRTIPLPSGAVTDRVSRTDIQGHRRVAGLENAIGLFVHGSGPGPDRSQRPIPLFFQLLDPERHELGFAPGDRCYEVLSDDQGRFDLPRSLPPILSVAQPGDEPDFPSHLVVVRHAHTEGAFELLHDVIEGGFQFHLEEFLNLAHALATVLEFLHGHGIVHAQWNARSVLCVPREAPESAFGDTASHRYLVLNTGVRFRDPDAVPRECLERGYFPEETLRTKRGMPEAATLDLGADVYCFSAFLRDVFQRATAVEDLTRQATRIRERFVTAMIRSGTECDTRVALAKEQEILDHLYTIKSRIESLIERGLRTRTERSSAATLAGGYRDLQEKTERYSRLLLESPSPTNVFGNELAGYVPYRITVKPAVCNSFEESTVAISGAALPSEVVRVSLGESDVLLEPSEIEEPGRRLRVSIPQGLPAGEHQILINNRRADQPLCVVSPTWSAVVPESVRQPWPGFGPIAVEIRARDLPSRLDFRLVAEGSEVAVTDLLAAEHEEASDPGEARAPLPSAPAFVDATAMTRESGADGERIRLEFPEDSPVGPHAIRCNGLDTGLRFRVDDPLPEPVLVEGGVSPGEVSNHREQRVTLSGRDFHEKMIVDLGEDRPAALGFELVGNRGREATLLVPEGTPPGDYPLRINRKESGVELRIHAPRWTAVSPGSVVLRRRQKGAPSITVSGANLPEIDPDRGDAYSLRTRTGKEIAGAVLEAREAEEGKSHTLVLSPRLRRGKARLAFGGADTRLRLRVRRQLPRGVWVVIALGLLGALGVAGHQLARALAPEITALDRQRVFNFHDTTVSLSGRRLERITLEEVDGTHTATIPLEAPEAEGEEGDEGRYRFSVDGFTPGEYRLVPHATILRGEPAAEPLTIASPRFELEPAVVDRLERSELVLSSASGFPIETIETPTLTLRRATPSVEQALEEDAPEPGLDFPLDGAGRFVIEAGALRPEQEGEYEVLLDGTALDASLSASGDALAVRVIGYRVTAIEPNPVTAASDESIEIAVRGERVPADLRLALVAGDTVSSTLQSDGSERFTGTAEPGSYALAWELATDDLETIAGVALAVHPPPRVTGVAPGTVRPGVPVDLRFTGLNLRRAGSIALRHTGATSVVELAVEPDRVLQTDVEAEYATRVVLDETGRYSVAPGEGVFLEVAEDCAALLEQYLADASVRVRLVSCLADRRVPADLRRQGADLFFDQGYFAAALALYRDLADLKSRFRTAFLRHFVESAADVELAVRDGDLPTSPYMQAAVALGWVPGRTGAPPVGSGNTWDVDFVRGHLAADPEPAIEAFELAIAKKRQAAADRAVTEFEPALDGLAAAYLDHAAVLLERGSPLRARETLEDAFFATQEHIERLGDDARSFCHFLRGHMTLWYAGGDEAAAASLRQGLESGAGGYALLCRRYLEVLGAVEERASGPRMTFSGFWGAFLTATKHYRGVRRAASAGILTEIYDFGVAIDAEERAASVELHEAVRNLETSRVIADPFARLALLFYLRNAQRLSWPGQEGGERATEHRRELLDLGLREDERAIRDLYLLEAQIRPLEPAQIAALRRDEVTRLGETLTRVEGSRLPAGFGPRVAALREVIGSR